MCTPPQTREQHLDGPLGNLRHLIHQGDRILRGAKAFEVRVAGNIGHLLHDNHRIVPESERPFEVVDLVVHILPQAPIFENRLNCIPCRLLQRFERLTRHHGPDIPEADAAAYQPDAADIRFSSASGPTAQDQLRKILCAASFALGLVLWIVLCVVPDENLFYLTAAVRTVVGLEEFPQLELSGRG